MCLEQHALATSPGGSLSTLLSSTVTYFFQSNHVLPQAWEVFKLICVYKDEHQHHADNHRHLEVLQDLPPPLSAPVSQTVNNK